jgi:hypothetical protein
VARRPTRSKAPPNFPVEAWARRPLAVSAGGEVGLDPHARQSASCKGGRLLLFILAPAPPEIQSRRRLRGVAVPCGHAPPRVWLGGFGIGTEKRCGATAARLPYGLSVWAWPAPIRIDLSQLKTWLWRLTRGGDDGDLCVLCLPAPTCVLCSR